MRLLLPSTQIRWFCGSSYTPIRTELTLPSGGQYLRSHAVDDWELGYHHQAPCLTLTRFKTSVAPPLRASLSASFQPIHVPTVPVSVATAPFTSTLMSLLRTKGLQKKDFSM